MKKAIMAVMIFSALIVKAQDEMTEQYKREIDHSFDYTAKSDNQGFCYGSSDKEITVLDTKTGEIKWNKKFNEISSELRKVDEIIPLVESTVIFVFDRNIGNDKMACIDVLTGSLLCISSNYQDVGEDSIIVFNEVDA